MIEQFDQQEDPPMKKFHHKGKTVAQGDFTVVSGVYCNELRWQATEFAGEAFCEIGGVAKAYFEGDFRNISGFAFKQKQSPDQSQVSNKIVGCLASQAPD